MQGTRDVTTKPTVRRSAFAAPIAVSACFFLTVLVFAPGQIYYGNTMDFPMLFAEMLPLLTAAALLGSILLSGTLIALPRGRPREVGISVVFGLALLAWLQGNFLLWQYGLLNGSPIDWASHWTHGLIDASIWCLVLAGALFGSRYVNPVAFWGSVALIVVQASGTALQASRSSDRWINHYSFDQSTRFSFSRDRNVVILVLDTFQSDLFQELLDEDPGIAEWLSGFTYFRNATGGFPSTAPSIPLILTGRYYDNAVPFQDFVKSTFKSASLPQTLKAANYHVYYNNLYYWPSLYADPSIASHVLEKTPRWHDAQSRRWASGLMLLGLFRSLPQAGKRVLEGAVARTTPSLAWDDAYGEETLPMGPHARGDARAEGDIAFFRAMTSLSSVAMRTPAFKYYHLWGIHAPLLHDENLRPVTVPYTRENAKRQAKGTFRLLKGYIETLTKLNIYDQSLLLIVADHGTEFQPFRPRLVEVDTRLRTGGSAPPVSTRNSFGLPLVLVKPIAATGAMRVSDAPVSLGDIPRTVTSALGMKSASPGESMFDPGLRPNRPRRVLKYNAEHLHLTSRYFPPLTEYVVSGFSWFDESWQTTGRSFHPVEPR
jgi:hypothetical protein